MILKVRSARRFATAGPRGRGPRADAREATISARAVHCRTTITAKPVGARAEAWTVDLSLGGVGLATERTLPTRQPVAVTFHLRDGAQKEVQETADGVIVRMQIESEGYLYGVEFTEPLNAARQPFLLRKFERA